MGRGLSRPWTPGGALLLAAGLYACGSREVAQDGAAKRTESRSVEVTDSISRIVFEDRTAAVDLHFDHQNGMSGERYLVEMMGAGVALLDFDNDGDLDLYLVQGGELKREREEGARGDQAGDRLFRNERVSAPNGESSFRFVDVTSESGIEGNFYGMGVAAGDYDGDGWIDLYVTNWGPNQLWQNNGDGTFREQAVAAGVADPRWSVPAVFLDFDRDGLLDLFVGNYVDFSLSEHRSCKSALGIAEYCGPLSFQPVANSLYRNLGEGRFSDVSVDTGFAVAIGATLGALAADFDSDGWLDLYVANDQMPNRLWRNEGRGVFSEQALSSGCAVNAEGRPEASMGLAAGDYDNDGDEDLFVTHLSEETHTLYLNDGTGVFEDASTRAGVGAPSWELTGFGVGFIDVENDGLLDLLTVSGAVKVIPEQAAAGVALPLRQRGQLFSGLGSGAFAEIDLGVESPLRRSGVSRGAAFGDLDNDGDTDVVVTENGGPARVLVNIVGSQGAWLGLRVTEGEPKRDALGAWVGVFRSGLPPMWRRIRSDGSYASASDPRLLFGLGADPRVERVEVRWTDGEVESWTGLEAGSYTSLHKGEGR